MNATQNFKATSKAPRCPKCGHRHVIKSGLVQQQQRYKCKACDYQYTRAAPKGRPLWQKSLAVFLYSYGMSMHEIARMFQVQPSTVLKWVRAYASDYIPAPDGGIAQMMELAEVRRHLKPDASTQGSRLCIVIDDEAFSKSKAIVISKKV